MYCPVPRTGFPERHMQGYSLNMSLEPHIWIRMASVFLLEKWEAKHPVANIGKLPGCNVVCMWDPLKHLETTLVSSSLTTYILLIPSCCETLRDSFSQLFTPLLQVVVSSS
jgi:hypothetical protein